MEASYLVFVISFFVGVALWILGYWLSLAEKDAGVASPARWTPAKKMIAVGIWMVIGSMALCLIYNFPRGAK